MARFTLTDDYLASTLRSLGRKDRGLAKALGRYGPPRQRRHPRGFATLVRALAGQQLSGKAAATIYGRVLDHFGGELDPARVSRSRVNTLRKLGLSQRKAEYLKGLARATTRGELELHRFGRMSDEAIIDQISSIRGFGAWSAQMYLIFSLGRPDVWPVDDLGVQKGMGHILARTELPRPRELNELGVRYAPHRSAVALIAWHVAGAPE